MTEYEGVYFWIPDCINPTLSGHMVKIGRSKDVLRRAGGVQTGCPYMLRQLWFLSVPGMTSKELEWQLHEDFDQLHSHHEWFVFSTPRWRMVEKTMPMHFQNCRWELLIDNGPLRGHYAHAAIKPEMIDGLVDEAIKRLWGKAA